MQYRTTCNNCGRDYMVDGNPGETIHAKCPYCGALANVVTPEASPSPSKGGEIYSSGVNTENVQPYSNNIPQYKDYKDYKKRKSGKPLYLRVTMWFLIIITILFIVMTILYLVFTGMSK